MERSAPKVRVEEWATQHGGQITWAVLRLLEVPEALIRVWTKHGWLIKTRPGVYAVGYVRTDREAQLWDALLYAGPGAYLTSRTAAHHLGLIDADPGPICVATPRSCRSPENLRVLRQHRAERVVGDDGIPTAPLTELILQLAADTGDFDLLRHALSNLDYRRQLDVTAIHAACRRGRPGSRLVRQALARHLPQLAHCRSPLEVAFIVLLDERHRVLPQVNVRRHGVLIDCWWPALRLAVELDGRDNHGTAAQLRRDGRTGAQLRSRGVTVERFTHGDVHQAPDWTIRRLADLGVQSATPVTRSRPSST